MTGLRYRILYSSHPPNLCRIQHLVESAREAGIPLSQGPGNWPRDSDYASPEEMPTITVYLDAELYDYVKDSPSAIIQKALKEMKEREEASNKK